MTPSLQKDDCQGALGLLHYETMAQGGRAGLDGGSLAGGEADAAYDTAGDAEEVFVWFVGCVSLYDVVVLWLVEG